MKTEINTNGETYFSKVGENGEIIYSFSENFEDTWSQEDEDLYGASMMTGLLQSPKSNGRKGGSASSSAFCSPSSESPI